MSALISAAELAKILQRPGVKILDASYHLPPAAGIAGALNFDIDDVADPQAPFAHTIPSAEIFAAKVGALGIGNDDLVVVYDRNGVYMAAARAWWMFRLFGHDNVKVLDGGLPAWVRAGLPVGGKAAAPPAPGNFRAAFRPELFKSLRQIRENIGAPAFTLLDARDAARFRGDAPEPRPNVPSGHIPGARNIPFLALLAADGMLKPRAQLEDVFRAAGIGLQQPLACSCGSGVTACVVALALHELGRKDIAVYDGSWTEWGSDPGLPKAKGA